MYDEGEQLLREGEVEAPVPGVVAVVYEEFFTKGSAVAVQLLKVNLQIRIKIVKTHALELLASCLQKDLHDEIITGLPLLHKISCQIRKVFYLIIDVILPGMRSFLLKAWSGKPPKKLIIDEMLGTKLKLEFS